MKSGGRHFEFNNMPSGERKPEGCHRGDKAEARRAAPVLQASFPARCGWGRLGALEKESDREH
jgi:hypothetical protein